MINKIYASYDWIKNALFHAHTAGETCEHGEHTHTGSFSPFVINSEREKMYARVLWACLSLNLGLFFIQFYIGSISYSITVLADAADLLGDSLNYIISLFIIGSTALVMRKANLIKIASMLLVSALVLAYALYKFFVLPHVPVASYMYGVGILSLIVNTLCVILLQKYKNDNANMYSAWACSLNDMVGGVFILFVAVLTTGFQSYWPDLIIGVFLVLISIYTSVKIWRQTVKY